MSTKPKSLDIRRSATALLPSTNVEGALQDAIFAGRGQQIFVKLDGGAKGDGKFFSGANGASLTSTVAINPQPGDFNLVNSPAANFTASDVGKAIVVRTAGVGGKPHYSTIVEYVSPTQVRMATGGQAAVNNQQFVFGTDDTAAITAADAAAIAAGKILHFEPGLYLANVLCNRAANTIWGWKGAGRNATQIWPATDAGYTAWFSAGASFVTQWWLADLSIFGFGVAASGAAAQYHIPLYMRGHSYGYIKNVQASQGLVGFLNVQSFGNEYDDCNFGDNTQTNYGYVGIGNATAYCGWHTFRGCKFKGSKAQYFVDGAGVPSNAPGEGNIHLRTDWEGAPGLTAYIRKSGSQSKPERWINCWVEGYDYAGSIDMTDLNAYLTKPVGTVNYERPLYITNDVVHGATTTEYPSFVLIDGVQVSPHVVGSYVTINNDEASDEPYYVPAPNGGKTGAVRYEDFVCGYVDGKNGTLRNFEAERVLPHRQTRDGGGCARSKTTKTVVDYSVVNYLLAPSASARTAVGSDSGVLISVVEDGPGFNLGLEITLPASSYVRFPGRGFAGAYTDTGANFTDAERNAMSAFSFAIRAPSGAAEVTLGVAPDGLFQNNLKLTDPQWVTYSGVFADSAWQLHLVNPSAVSPVTVRVSGLQVVLSNNFQSLLTFMSGSKIAAISKTGEKLHPSISNSQLAALIATADFGQPPINIITGQPVLTVPVGERQNGNFNTWTTPTDPANWYGGRFEGDSFTGTTTQNSADKISGAYSCDFSTGVTDPYDSRSSFNWLTSPQANFVVGRRYRLQGWFKFRSGGGNLECGSTFGERFVLVDAADPNKSNWQFKFVELTASDANGFHGIFLCGGSYAGGGAVWGVDQIQIIDITDL